MKLEQVLKILYGNIAEGYLSFTYFSGNSSITKSFQADKREEMACAIREAGKFYNTYININPRKKALPESQRGGRRDILYVVAAYGDYDIRGPAHKETALPLNSEEVYIFLDKVPVKPTFLVFTGNGIHAYWVFEIPFLIKDEADRAHIEKVLKGWERYVHKLAKKLCGWKLDPVADLSRMLRAVETINFKTKEQPTCEIVSFSNHFCTVEELEKYCDITDMPMAESEADDMDEFAFMGTGSGKELIENCKFLQYCRDEAGQLSEPYWFGMISNVAPTADGHALVHELSSPHPNYTYDETEAKYGYAIKADKPVTCEYIKNHLGFNCGRECGVKAPIALVHSNKRSFSPSWEEPIPFDSCRVPAFPADALPDCIRDYVTAVAESTQTPVDLAATAAMAVLSTCIQGKYVIMPKADWHENLNIYALAIMEPSERKSAVHSLMTKPLDDYEKDWNRIHAAEIDFSKSERSILERRLKNLEDQASKGKVEISEVRKASEELTNFMEKKPLRLYSDDVTTEKLVSILANNNGKAAILSAEGGIFDMLRGIYTRYVNIDVFLKGYSGDPIRIDRVGRESEDIFNPTLTILLMAQPSVLSGVMQNDTFRGRGLTARFLYCIPHSNVGSRRYRTKAISNDVCYRYEQCIHNLLCEEPDCAPEVITLSAEADRLLETFAEELEPKMKTEYADIADWIGKLVGNIARIAGLLCRASVHRVYDFLSEPEPLVVSGEEMESAIRIGRYYTEHAKAAFSLMGADDGAKRCKYVLDAVRKSGLTEFTRRDVMRLCRSLKTVDLIQPVLNQLVDYGYLAVKETENITQKGRPPASTYLVNPCIYENQ